MKIIASVLTAAAAALAGCSSSVASTTPPPSAGNPVAILQQMHIPILTGTTEGRTDVYGNRYASGQFADGERVTVYTYAAQQAETDAITRFGAPGDVNKLLVGGLFTVTVTGVDEGSGGVAFPESLVTLSRETGAKIKG